MQMIESAGRLLRTTACGALFLIVTIAVLLTYLLITWAVWPAAAESNKNYGKSDDYGSARFAQVNQCMVELINNQKTPDPKGKALSQCMKDNGYAFLPNARVFGNSGSNCKDDKLGVFHSWCWGHLE